MDNLVCQKLDENNNLMCSKINGKHVPISECLACGRQHLFNADECEHRGEHFQPDWMQKRIRQHNKQHLNKPKEPIKSSNPQVFSAEIKPTVKEAELYDKGDEDLDAMMKNMADDNDNVIYSGNADTHQENDTFYF